MFIVYSNKIKNLCQNWEVLFIFVCPPHIARVVVCIYKRKYDQSYSLQGKLSRALSHYMDRLS